MHIDRKIGAAPDLGRHFDDANAPAGKAADLGMRLDAANEVEIGLRGFHGGVDVDAVGAIEVGVVMSFQAADQIGRQKGQRARFGRLGNEMPETGKRHAGRATLIDQRGHAGLDADHIGVHAEAPGDVLIDMGVGVDQAGQDDLAGDVDDLFGAGREDIGLHCGDLAVTDRYVFQAVDSGGRIDHAASAQEQVEAGIYGHG